MLSKVVSKVRQLGLSTPEQIVSFTMGYASAASAPLTLHVYGNVKTSSRTSKRRFSYRYAHSHAHATHKHTHSPTHTHTPSDHCPYCVRVELALGWKNIAYSREVYGYGDTMGDPKKGLYYGYVAFLFPLRLSFTPTHSAHTHTHSNKQTTTAESPRSRERYCRCWRLRDEILLLT